MTRLAQVFFIISLVVPMLVPAGMMLSKDHESNIIELSICSATNPRTVLFDLQTGSLVTPDPHLASTEQAVEQEVVDHGIVADEICPFDLATSDLLFVADLNTSDVIQPSADLARIHHILLFKSEHPSRPPRGPPVLI